jgi:hypothetical protein
MAWLTIHVLSNATNRIKDSFRGCRDTCTMFKAVSAMLPQCRTRAVISDDPEGPMTLLFSSNLHKIVGAKEGYDGNYLAAEIVEARSSVLASADI